MWAKEIAGLNNNHLGRPQLLRRAFKKVFCGIYRELRDFFTIAQRLALALVQLIKFTFL